MQKKQRSLQSSEKLYQPLNLFPWGNLKNMSRKILVASVLVIASAIGFCAPVKAETADVPFNGTIAPKCTFTNVTAGTLAIGTLNSYLEGSSQHGTQGSATLSCNTSATLTVGEPVDLGGTGPTKFTGPFMGSLITTGTTTAGSPKAIANKWQGVTNSSLSISPITNTNIKVSVVQDAGTGVTIQAGTYKFKTTLTSTP
jgi:hypothetical protein